MPKLERRQFPAILAAMDRDAKLGGFIEIDVENNEGTIKVAPFVQATGRLLDDKGLPAPSRNIQTAFEVRTSGFINQLFVEKVVTDSDGKFTLKKLIAG